jgi:hypothetical protein
MRVLASGSDSVYSILGEAFADPSGALHLVSTYLNTDAHRVLIPVDFIGLRPIFVFKTMH